MPEAPLNSQVPSLSLRVEALLTTRTTADCSPLSTSWISPSLADLSGLLNGKLHVVWPLQLDMK